MTVTPNYGTDLGDVDEPVIGGSAELLFFFLIPHRPAIPVTGQTLNDTEHFITNFIWGGGGII